MMSADSQEPTSHGDPKLMQPAARSAVPRTYMYTCKFKVYIYVLYVDASIDLKCVFVCVYVCVSVCM